MQALGSSTNKISTKSIHGITNNGEHNNNANMTWFCTFKVFNSHNDGGMNEEWSFVSFRPLLCDSEYPYL
jgi:hypothetical protein